MKKHSHFHAELGTDGALEMLIYGDIVDAATISSLEAWGYNADGFVSSLGVKKALDSGGSYSKIRLRINSPGGDAFEGTAIHSLLTGQGKPVEAYIDGMAASAASIIAMAASKRVMGRSAMMMIHDAWGGCMGNRFDMQKTAESLGKLDEAIAAAYVDRTGIDQKTIQKMMDDETWLSAQDCLDQGFATEIVAAPAKEEKKAMAAARRFAALANLRNIPAQFKAAACECDCDECVGGDCPSCTNQDCTDPNCTDCPMQNSASAKKKPPQAKSCACACENCAAGNCKNCTTVDCADDACKNCPMQSKTNRLRSDFHAAADGDTKTKKVDGEELAWDDFIVALDHEDPTTWHLPWKFSTLEKTKSHLRDALARFDQVQGLSKEQKHAAYTKLVGLCKKYGIEVVGEAKSRYETWTMLANCTEAERAEYGEIGRRHVEMCAAKARFRAHERKPVSQKV